LFNALLHRQPSAADSAYWVQLLDQGVPRATVVQGICPSGQFGQLYQAIVNQLYMTYMNRPADAAGLNYWGTQLQMGVPISKIVVGILSSPAYFAQATS